MSNLPTIERLTSANNTQRLTGAWRVQNLMLPKLAMELSRQLSSLAKDPALIWDLSGLETLDYVGAQLIWNSWNKQRPQHLQLAPEHETIFALLAQHSQTPPAAPTAWQTLRQSWHDQWTNFWGHWPGVLTLIGQLVLDTARFLRHPLQGPWKEISANIYHIGFQALSVTALVGFLIGVVLSYLSAQQLHTFGGDIYLVNILGMSIVRELGPMLAAILVAGRSGSAITAQLGVMRVTEELDAMLVMGLPHGFRLILPRVIALAVAMPLLVIWTDAMALLGGMMAAKFQLGLSPTYFAQRLPNVVPLANYWIGLGKGVAFGSLIAIIACHFGLRIEPNTESLGRGTTNSVVSAITVVILADAVFSIVFSSVGYY